MTISDRVYGKIIISEPIITDLIKSQPIQRLKEIDQAGYFEPFFPGTKHTRFEHSLGVYFLLKKFKASLNEQIAGLIHDVSHSAFSHCIDYVLNEGSPKNHDHQDNIFEEFIKKTKIPKILRKYNIDIELILDDKNFPLKEKKLPDLCADRIDYSLRTAVVFKEISRQDVKYFLDNLIIDNQHWVFKNIKSAKDYAELFLKLNRQHYAGFQSAVMFRTVGDCLKYSLDHKYIDKRDLYQTDNFVLKKIFKHLKQDQQLNIFWQRMNNKIKAVNDPKNYDESVFVKSRVVDPLFINKGKISRLSDVYKNWRKIVQEESVPKEYFLKFI